MCGCFVFCFFCKQKTAYEMRISDWSSDVCSSDLRYRLRADSLTALHSTEDLRRLQAVDRRLLREHRFAGQPGFAAALGRHRRSIDQRLQWRDRKSVVYGKSVSVRVDLGGRRILKNKINYTTTLSHNVTTNN